MNSRVLIVLAAVCLCLTATAPSKTSEKGADPRRIQRQTSKLIQRITRERNARQPESRHIDLRKINTARLTQTKSVSSTKLTKTIDYMNCPTNIGANTVCGVVLPLLHCYCFVLTPQSWADARDFCTTNNMNLLRIESLRELAQLGAVSLSTDEWWTDAYLTTVDFYALGGLTTDYYDFLRDNTCPTVTMPDFPSNSCNSTISKTGAVAANSELDPGPVVPCTKQSGIVMIGITFKRSCFSAQPSDSLLLSICQS